MMVGQACMKTSLVEGRGSGAVEERDKTKCTCTMDRVGFVPNEACVWNGVVSVPSFC